MTRPERRQRPGAYSAGPCSKNIVGQRCGPSLAVDHISTRGRQRLRRGVVDTRRTEHNRFTRASVNGADRGRQLTLAASLLHNGRVVEPGWIAAQLLDLRDLLGAEEVRHG